MPFEIFISILAYQRLGRLTGQQQFAAQRLTLPLMVQSGDGATDADPDAEAKRIVEAFSGGLAAPKIVVFLLRARQSHGAMKAPWPHPGLGFARSFFVGIVIVRKPRIGQRLSPLVTRPFLDAPPSSTSQRATMCGRAGGRSGAHGRSRLLAFDVLWSARRAPQNPAGPALAAVCCRGSWSVEGASTAAVAGMRLLPIWTVVAVADLWHAGDVGRAGDRGRQYEQNGW